MGRSRSETDRSIWVLKYKLVLRPIALNELEEAADSFENERTGLGLRFSRRARQVFRSIQRAPKQFPRVFKNYRRALVKPFRYAIHFYEVGDEVIVVSVFHGSRNPSEWQSRS
jgi:plasmid stabilization system protein ParE